MEIGFIGLGIMGSRMAMNLVKEGASLTVHNRDKSKAKALIDAGAKWSEDVGSLAKKSDIIISMLSTPEVVEHIAFGESGFVESMKNDALWVDCSTVNPSFVKETSVKVKGLQKNYIEAPVAGTKGPAEKGELVFLVGGTEEHLAKCNSLLDIMGKKTIHLGSHGSGASMKLLINKLLAQSMLAFSEALSLGNGMGLDQSKVMDVLLGTPVTAPFLGLVRNKIEEGNFDANFPLKWMHKDLHLAAVTAYENGVSLPLLNTAKEVFAMAKSGGYADKDFSAVSEYLSSQES